MKPRAVNGCPGCRLQPGNLSPQDHVDHRTALALAPHANRPIRHQAPTDGSDRSHCGDGLPVDRRGNGASRWVPPSKFGMPTRRPRTAPSSSRDGRPSRRARLPIAQTILTPPAIQAAPDGPAFESRSHRTPSAQEPVDRRRVGCRRNCQEMVQAGSGGSRLLLSPARRWLCDAYLCRGRRAAPAP